MRQFVGTGALARLALRLDRVRLPIWILVITALVQTTASSFDKLYTSAAARARFGNGIASNPSLVALYGRVFDPTSTGGLTAWRVGGSAAVLAALMSLLTVVRHTRAEEEAGRLELVGAGVVGRYAPLTAALLVAAGADVAIATLTTLTLIGVGLPAAGSVALGLALGATGLMFAAVAAVTAQLTEGARAANGAAAAVLGVAYLLRAIGDTGPTWLSWLSPVGWALRLRPFAGERWWVMGLAVAFVAVGIGTAYVLVGRRDLGAGLVQPRPGRAQASPALRSPLALAWRLHRGALIGWAIGLTVWGAALGGAANGIGNLVSDNQQIADILARMGGRKGIVDAFLATVLSVTGLLASAYTVQSALRPRGEETAQRAEPLLATGVGRLRWAVSHLVFAVAGTMVLLASAGAAAGLTYGLRIHDVGGQVPRLLGAALVQLPAALVLTGVTMALVGLAPRLAVGSWATLVAFLLLLELGPLLKLNHWLMDVSPFTHVPKVPGAPLTATPLLWLVAVAVTLTVAGLVGLRRRDIG